MQGSSELRVVEDFFDIDLPGKPTDTVSLGSRGHTEEIPGENETFTIDKLEVGIIKASDRRIDQVDGPEMRQADDMYVFEIARVGGA